MEVRPRHVFDGPPALLAVATAIVPALAGGVQVQGEPPAVSPPATAPGGTTPQLLPERQAPQPPAVSRGDLAPAQIVQASPAVQAELARLRTVAAAPRGAGRRSAAWLLGLAALHGIGGPVDPMAARVWFLRAQQLGEPLAAAGLAWCAVDGCGGAPDPAQARRWIAALRPLDAGRALYLEWLLQMQLASPPPSAAVPGVPPGGAPLTGPVVPVPGHRQLEAAAAAGSVHARLELALEQAAAGRDADALGQMRALAARSPAAAANVALLAQRAAESGLRAGAPGAEAFERAQRAHRGEGQPANFAEAIRLYQLARQQGSVPAARLLALIFSRPAPGGGVDIVWMQQLARVDVTKDLPTVEPTITRRLLQREPTALSDLVPARWRTEARVPAQR